jgi:hypothetical protein
MSKYSLDGQFAASMLASAPAVLAAPTQAEITAGTDLVGSTTTEELRDIRGFVPSGANLSTKGYSSNKAGSIVGAVSYPLAELEWMLDDVSSVIDTAIVEGTKVWLVFMREGQAATNSCEVFPATIAAKFPSYEDDVVHTFVGQFSHDVPVDGVQAA